METSGAKNNMSKDTLFYLLVKGVEGIIGMVTLSLYSYYFSPSIMGNYNLLIQNISFITLLTLGWLMQSGFRYLNSFNGQLKIKVFYSTIFRIWLIASSASILMGFAALLFIKPLTSNSTFNFLIISIFIFNTYSTAQILFTILGSARIIKLNLSLSIFSITFKLICTTILVKVFHLGIIAAFSSVLFADLIVIMVVTLRLKIYKYIVFKMFSKKVFQKFLRYGFSLIGVVITMSFLNISDRYVIKFMLEDSNLGIYTTNYSVASAIFTLILVAVMRGVYPTILKTWRKNDKERTEELLSHGVRYFLLIALPAAIGLGVLSPTISKVLLAPEYREGSSIIAWVGAGMLLLGLSEYNNKAWELTSKTSRILRYSLASAVFNLVTNIIFVPIYGYHAAAATTTLSFLLYFILTYISGRKVLKWHLPLKTFVKIIGSASAMGLIIWLSIPFMPSSILTLGVLVIGGMAIYTSSLLLTGEIIPEFKKVLYLLKRMKIKSH